MFLKLLKSNSFLVTLFNDRINASGKSGKIFGTFRKDIYIKIDVIWNSGISRE